VPSRSSTHGPLSAKWGFPRIHASTEAQTITTLGMARTATIELSLWTFYVQGKLEDLVTLLVILGVWVGAVDALVCWKEGIP
jgi:hypothetical protein